MFKRLKWAKVYAIFALIVALTVTYYSEDGKGDDVRAAIDSYGLPGVICRFAIGQMPPTEILEIIQEVRQGAYALDQRLRNKVNQAIKTGLTAVDFTWTLTDDGFVEADQTTNGLAAWITRSSPDILERVARLSEGGYSFVTFVMDRMPALSDLAKLDTLSAFWTILYETEVHLGDTARTRLFSNAVEKLAPNTPLTPGMWTIHNNTVVNWIGTDSKLVYIVGTQRETARWWRVILRSRVHDIFVRFTDVVPNGWNRPAIPTMQANSITVTQMVWGNQPKLSEDRWLELKEVVRRQKKPP